MQGLNKSEQNKACLRAKWRKNKQTNKPNETTTKKNPPQKPAKQNTIKTCSNISTFCMQINVMYNSL